MDEFQFMRRRVPAFGSWDLNDTDLQFTQCFETARQGRLFRYSYSEDRDLYVAGDLYKKDVVTPAVIAVPRRRAKLVHPQVKKNEWVVADRDTEMKASSKPFSVSAPPPPAQCSPVPKAVDKDLYSISPDLLCAPPKRKKVWGLFSSCIQPACAPR